MKITHKYPNFWFLGQPVKFDYELHLSKFNLLRLQDKSYLIIFNYSKNFDRIITKIEKLERKHFKLYNEMVNI